MQYTIKVKELPKTVDDRDQYYFKLKTYNGLVEGKFEKSELRHIIEAIDNAI